MSRYLSRRAIVVLESPWELDETDANRTSVLPFVEGIGKLTGDTAVHYANFYDKSSFEKGLECLCKGDLKGRIVYIAAHGKKDRIGNVRLMDLLSAIALKSEEFQIDGVVLGACFVGGRTIDVEDCIKGSRLRWCVGYSAAVDWLPATLVDCSILSAMSGLRSDVFKSRKRLISKIASAVELFNPHTIIGVDVNENGVALQDALSVVAQPVGQGFRAKEVSEDVWFEHTALEELND
jgi:hypothetical protein